MSENIYAVLIRSAEGRLSGVGAHRFDEPLREGAEVTFEGETWTVEEVRPEETPPSAILHRTFVKPS